MTARIIRTETEIPKRTAELENFVLPAHLLGEEGLSSEPERRSNSAFLELFILPSFQFHKHDWKRHCVVVQKLGREFCVCRSFSLGGPLLQDLNRSVKRRLCLTPISGFQERLRAPCATSVKLSVALHRHLCFQESDCYQMSEVCPA